MSDNEQQRFNQEESASNKLARKSEEAPFMVFGLAGLVAICGYGIYKYKNRGDMKTSVFLIHLRVAAQGFVVGALSLGVAYSTIMKFLNKNTNETRSKSSTTSDR